MRAALRNISWPVVLILAVFLGLAPFTPEPHLWEKLKMLAAGDLRRGVDWFDLVMHGAPVVLLVAKVIVWLQEREK